MITDLKKRFRKLFKWSIGLFVTMFVFRMIYGYVSPETRSGNQSYGSDFFSSIDNVRRNYASEKKMYKSDEPTQAAAAASSDKFEKTALIKSKSSAFEKDEKQLKAKTKAFNAIIQYEQNIGQKGNRQIHLLIGVAPALFDSFYTVVQQIGVVKAIEITKVDKTTEYKKLNAQKASLEKTLQSLTDLKAKGGQIADFVSLHDKILEIEGRLQELGVELGNFDSENEFCTVKMSLYEGETEKRISFIQRLKVSFEWTVTYFSITVFSLLGLSVFILVVLIILDKLKVMAMLMKEK